MNVRLATLAETLREAPSLEAFWNLALAALNSRGVESVFYAAFTSRTVAHPDKLTSSTFWKSNHPRQFIETFGVRTVIDGEFSAQQSMIDPKIFVWHDVEEWKNATPAQVKRSHIERDMGLYVGLTIPACQFGSNQAGAIGVSTPTIKDTEFERYWRSRGDEILFICGLLDIGMRRQHISEMVGLSPREKECLTYLAIGLRPDQIAERLGIGFKSVEKYLAYAKLKLKANTRDHAVAKALMFNVIQP